jgi:hypothetical protein
MFRSLVSWAWFPLDASPADDQLTGGIKMVLVWTIGVGVVGFATGFLIGGIGVAAMGGAIGISAAVTATVLGAIGAALGRWLGVALHGQASNSILAFLA